MTTTEIVIDLAAQEELHDAMKASSIELHATAKRLRSGMRGVFLLDAECAAREFAAAARAYRILAKRHDAIVRRNWRLANQD